MALKGDFGGQKQDLPFSDEPGVVHQGLGFWASLEGAPYTPSQQQQIGEKAQVGEVGADPKSNAETIQLKELKNLIGDFAFDGPGTQLDF